jgi:hypothetical protein
MGKLKEKLLNNHNEDVNPFELSAFEYVEYMSDYKDKQDEYIPTDEELEKLNQMLEEYYKSKEFRDYVENYQPVGESLTELEDEFFGKWTNEDMDTALVEHNAHEEGFDLESINESIKLKYSDNDVLDVITKLIGDTKLIDTILDELRQVWNNKNGII